MSKYNHIVITIKYWKLNERSEVAHGYPIKYWSTILLSMHLNFKYSYEVDNCINRNN